MEVPYRKQRAILESIPHTPIPTFGNPYRVSILWNVPPHGLRSDREHRSPAAIRMDRSAIRLGMISDPMNPKLAAAAGTTVSNQATIAFDADGDGTNESSRLSDDPTQPGSSDPTTFTVASPGE